jgi:hypothetical protein
MHSDQDTLDQTAQRARLTLDVTPEMRRRIRLAAAQRDLTIKDYVERILDQALPPLAELEARQQRSMPPSRPLDPAAAERLLGARDRVMAGRTFADDSTELIREAREQRLAEL